MARERYLHNAGEDTIHDNEIKLVTGKDKRQNWWYYHKVHLFAGIVAFVILGTFVYSIVTKVEPDYTIGMFTSFSMPSTGISQLEECIAQYADDRNGDGKVKVTVNNYVFSSDEDMDYQQLQASQVRFTADVTTNSVMIYLHDEEAMEMAEGVLSGMFQYNDGTPMPEDATDFENAMVPWDDFVGFAEFQPQTDEDDLYDGDILTQLYERLSVSVRTPENSSIEHSEKDMAYYEDCVALYQRIKSGEKLNTETASEEG